MKKFTGALISRNPKSACKKRQLLQSFLLSYSKHYFTGSTVRSTLYSLLIKNNTRYIQAYNFYSDDLNQETNKSAFADIFT